MENVQTQDPTLSPANQLEDTTRELESAVEPEVEEYQPQIPEGMAEVIFRHKTINHFVVGRFVFRDHILRLVGTEAEVAALEGEFLQLYRGLMPMDRNNIKRVINTQPALFESQAVRGAVGTHQIVDKAAPTGGLAAPKPPLGFNFKKN